MRIVIVGAGTMGGYLANELVAEGHNVYIVERVHSKARELAERTDAMLIAGEALDPRVLEEAEIANADLLLAVTDSDELNIVLAGLAKEMGVERTVARVRSDSYSLPEAQRLLLSRLEISQIINPVETSVSRIFDHISLPAASEVTRLAGGKAYLVTFRVADNCPIKGMPLAGVREHPFQQLPLVVAVYRAGAVLVPGGSDVLSIGDEVSFIVPHDEMHEFAGWFAPGEPANERIVLLGARGIGLHLARRLKEAGKQVTLIDEDAEQCQRAAAGLADVEILRGRITDESVREEVALARVDFLVACTEDEESNLIAAMWAKEHGTRRTMVVTERPEYVELLRKLRVDVVVSPRIIAAGELLRFVRRGIVLSAAKVAEGRPGRAEVLEFLVTRDSPVAGKPLKSAGLPKGTLVGLLVESERVVVPHGDTTLEPGARALVFSTTSALKRVQRLFAPQ